MRPRSVAGLVITSKCRVELGRLRVFNANCYLPDAGHDVDKPLAGSGNPSLHIRPRRRLLAAIRNWQGAGRGSWQGRENSKRHQRSNGGPRHSNSVFAHLYLVPSTLLRLKCHRGKLLLSRRSRETDSGPTAPYRPAPVKR